MSIDIKKLFRVCNPSYTLDYAKPEDRLLASGGDDAAIKLWRLDAFVKDDLDQLLTDGCRRLQGYLSNNPQVNESDRHLCDQRLTSEFPHHLSH